MLNLVVMQRYYTTTTASTSVRKLGRIIPQRLPPQPNQMLRHYQTRTILACNHCDLQTRYRLKFLITIAYTNERNDNNKSSWKTFAERQISKRVHTSYSPTNSSILLCALTHALRLSLICYRNCSTLLVQNKLLTPRIVYSLYRLRRHRMNPILSFNVAMPSV